MQKTRPLCTAQPCFNAAGPDGLCNHHRKMVDAARPAAAPAPVPKPKPRRENRRRPSDMLPDLLADGAAGPRTQAAPAPLDPEGYRRSRIHVAAMRLPEWCRRPPERQVIGWCAAYLELERLLGYREPTGYRPERSGPADWLEGGGPHWTAGVA
jgi:hypothetical protein